MSLTQKHTGEELDKDNAKFGKRAHRPKLSIAELSGNPGAIIGKLRESGVSTGRYQEPAKQKKNQKTIFEMDAGEFRAHLTPMTVSLVNESLVDGFYLSYPAGDPFRMNQFIHAYLDHRIKVVSINTTTGEEIDKGDLA